MFSCFYVCFWVFVFFLAAGSKSGILYHVQYFGDAPERGYIFERNMVSFRGEHQYQDLSQRNKQQQQQQHQPPSRALHKNVNVHFIQFPHTHNSRPSTLVKVQIISATVQANLIESYPFKATMRAKSFTTLSFFLHPPGDATHPP